MFKKLLYFIAILGAFFAVVVLSGIAKQVGKILVQPIVSTSQEAELKLIDELKKGLKEYNQNTPRMIDDDTRMDAATIGPGYRLNINYTLPKHATGKIGADQLIQRLRPLLENYACNKKNMKIMMQWGAVFAYSYHAKDQTLITSILIDRDDCGLRKISR